jgi:hypothetical protein
VRPTPEAKESPEMKAILIITDSEAVPAFEHAFASGRRGFTVIPGLVGMGKSGLKAGDRIHPGGSSLVLTVGPDEKHGETVDLVRRARDGSGYAGETRMWSFAVDEIG